MNKVETSLRLEGESVFCMVQLYDGEKAANGRISWTKNQHHDVNLSYEHEAAFNRLVLDGWLTSDDVARIRFDAEKMTGAPR